MYLYIYVKCTTIIMYSNITIMATINNDTLLILLFIYCCDQNIIYLHTGSGRMIISICIIIVTTGHIV